MGCRTSAYGPRITTPRLAGARPKLRPSVSLPSTTNASPSAEAAAVTTSGTSPPASEGRRSGGPTTEMAVTIAARTDRSTMCAGRLMTVSTITSASLTSSSRPVIRPVRRKSCRILMVSSVKSTLTVARARSSEVLRRGLSINECPAGSSTPCAQPWRTEWPAAGSCRPPRDRPRSTTRTPHRAARA